MYDSFQFQTGILTSVNYTSLVEIWYLWHLKLLSSVWEGSAGSGTIVRRYPSMSLMDARTDCVSAPVFASASLIARLQNQKVTSYKNIKPSPSEIRCQPLTGLVRVNIRRPSDTARLLTITNKLGSALCSERSALRVEPRVHSESKSLHNLRLCDRQIPLLRCSTSLALH